MKEPDIMKDDLLAQLAQTAKEMEVEETAQLSARWQRLATGSLDQKKAAALAKEAQKSEEARRNYERLQPLGNDFHDRVLGALQTQPGGGAAASPSSSRVLPFRRRTLRMGGLVAAAAALAAAMLLLIGRPPAEFPPLPEYQVQLLGGAKEQRAGDGGRPATPRFVDGNRLEVRLRPASPASGEVAVRCFLAREEILLRWDAAAEISSQGAVRITGEVGRDLAIAPGIWTLWLTVGRPTTLPDIEQLRADLTTPSSPPWSLYRTSFEIGPPSTPR